MRAMTQREAVLCREFGFKWVLGSKTGFIPYDEISQLEPTSEGFLLVLHARETPRKLRGIIIAVDLPCGSTAVGDQTLENAHIFVYCEMLWTDDGTGWMVVPI